MSLNEFFYNLFLFLYILFITYILTKYEKITSRSRPLARFTEKRALMSLNEPIPVFIYVLQARARALVALKEHGSL